MRTLTVIVAIFIAVIFSFCGDSGKTTENNQLKRKVSDPTTDPATYDPNRGIGKYTAETVVLSDKLDKSKAKAGQDLANVKCTSCHKMTDEKLVGPGWKDVTTRRTPAWLMNFITDPGPMIDKDPEAQAMLELCLVRMPNQNLSDDDARNLLEYMREIDGVK